MENKRRILIVLFLITTVALGYLIYRVFFAGSPMLPSEILPSDGSPTAPGSFPTPNTSDGRGTSQPSTGDTRLPTSEPVVGVNSGLPTRPTVTPVTEDFVRGVTSAATGVRFYNRQDGRFYRADQNGRLELLSDEVFYNVEQVTWAPSKNVSILEYPDGANIYYNFDSKEQVTLPKQWEDFSFAPDGNKIAAKSIGYSPENRWLIAANPDGTNVRLVEPLGQNASKVTVSWSPNKQVIAFSATGQELGVDRVQILPIGLNGENFRALTVEGRDMRSRWSPSGQKILYSVYNANNNFKPTLWIDRGDGENIGTGRKLLSVDTWADKCVFADDRYVYCGVPQTLPRGAGFAPELANETPDDLYRIDTETGMKTELRLDSEHVIDTISIDTTNNTLYFTDKTKSGVFSLPL